MIMDYKEKYNAALVRARQFIEHPLQEDSENIAEYIFPELTMSEDERIRKALIEMIHDTTGDECEDCYHVSKESVLAWLEKQGKKLDPDKVIEWLECKAFQGWAEEINIKQIVNKFKKDFSL